MGPLRRLTWGHARNCCYRAIDMVVSGDQLYVGGLFDGWWATEHGHRGLGWQAWTSSGSRTRDHVIAIGALESDPAWCEPALPR